MTDGEAELNYANLNYINKKGIHSEQCLLWAFCQTKIKQNTENSYLLPKSICQGLR